MKTEYYEKQLEKGLAYQDYVMEKFISLLGIPITNYSSKKYQYNIGENKQGIEIKFDDKYKDTGNLFIEVAEKTNKNNLYYVDSGIMRYDNSWLYLIGNYEIIYIFSIKQLKMIKERKDIIEIKEKTAQGFLLNPNDIKKYSINEIN